MGAGSVTLRPRPLATPVLERNAPTLHASQTSPRQQYREVPVPAQQRRAQLQPSRVSRSVSPVRARRRAGSLGCKARPARNQSEKMCIATAPRTPQASQKRQQRLQSCRAQSPIQHLTPQRPAQARSPPPGLQTPQALKRSMASRMSRSDCARPAQSTTGRPTAAQAMKPATLWAPVRARHSAIVSSNEVSPAKQTGGLKAMLGPLRLDLASVKRRISMSPKTTVDDESLPLSRSSTQEPLSGLARLDEERLEDMLDLQSSSPTSSVCSSWLPDTARSAMIVSPRTHTRIEHETV